MKRLQVRRLILSDGERYRVLVDGQTGLPLYYPTLYATSQVRNASLSVSAIESTLSCLKHFLILLESWGTGLEQRILNRQYFSLEELDQIRDHCQLNLRDYLQHKESSEHDKPAFSLVGSRVSRSTQSLRLSVISDYLQWLSEKLLSSTLDETDQAQLQRIRNGLKARRPRSNHRNTSTTDDKALSEDAVEILLAIIEPGHVDNPFRQRDIALRNELIILLLLHLGVRLGELLGIKVRDIDFSQQTLTIHRCPDDPQDPRTDEPNTKTRSRSLPLGKGLVRRLAHYITENRSAVSNADSHDVLLVSHFRGPYQGKPLSRESVKKLIHRLSLSHPQLSTLHAHALRHTWNDRFSLHCDQLREQDQLSDAEEEQMRSHLMGWLPGSGTAAIYNKRHNQRKAHQASLTLQNQITGDQNHA